MLLVAPSSTFSSITMWNSGAILFDQTLITDTNVTGKLLKFNATCHRWMYHTVLMNKAESDNLQTGLAHLVGGTASEHILTARLQTQQVWLRWDHHWLQTNNGCLKTESGDQIPEDISATDSSKISVRIVELPLKRAALVSLTLFVLHVKSLEEKSEACAYNQAKICIREGEAGPLLLKNTLSLI